MARNEVFQKLARDISDVVFKTGLVDVSEIEKQALPNGLTVGDGLKEVISKMGENILLRRSCCLEKGAPSSILCSYQHNSVGPNMSQIASLVSFSVEGDGSKLDQDKLHKIGMHIAAASPLYLTRAEVPEAALEREKSVIMEMVKKLNKPEKILNRMIEGKLGEFYKQSVLLDQLFILDEKQGSISKLLQKLGKEAGCKVAIEKFVRFQVGK